MATEWTVDTLKEHVEKILAEKDKAINIALAAAKEAVGVAETNAEKWRTNANEWRQAMNDKDKLLMTRSEFEIYKASTQTALTIEKTRADKDEGKGLGMNAVWGYIIGLVGLVATILAIASRFIQ